MRRALLATCLAVAGCSAPAVGTLDPAPRAQPQPGRQALTTRWGRALDPARPQPDYPRPTLVRERWQSLNGTWQFEPGLADQPPPLGRALPGRVLVPFPVESALSGVARHHDRCWYKRAFEVPDSWGTDRVLLHFGAVDWEAEVWVNGVPFPVHRGGYEAFTLDITDALLPDVRPQEVVVRVFDPTDAGEQPRGKQVLDPRGIWYSPVTGIWQSVWLEPVPRRGIQELEVAPDLERGGVTVTAVGVDVLGEDVVEVEVLERGGLLAARRGAVGQPLFVAVPAPRPWSPSDPFLYDLRVTRTAADGRVRDRVTSYFGLRTVAVRPDAQGVPRIHLNGKPLFAMGLLDQGWWPDGLYTAPSDEALRSDVALAKELGFNTLRKHVKVEPERWYTWCDRLGMLVFQDMPSGDNRSEAGREQFERELESLVRGRGRHPSIVQWVVFNEGWGQYDTERLTRRVQELDPSRLVTCASGWDDAGVGDARDEHHYPGPVLPRESGGRAAVLGEFGGLALPVEGHVFERGAWGYATVADGEELTLGYELYQCEIARLRSEGLAAAIYTQLSDVEVECNGLVTYDRERVKVDAERVARANRGQLPTITTLLATSESAGRPWSWRTTPPQDGWRGEQGGDLGQDGWSTDSGGFGTQGTPGTERSLRTVWDTPEIWLRSELRLAGPPPEGELLVRVHHDEDVQVWINGTSVLERKGHVGGYEVLRTGRAASEVLRSGTNVVSAHCRQTGGGQFIDLGLEVVQPRP